MLKVKKLDPRAILPTVANPGEDLGYDLYALEDTILRHGEVTKVRTGIAAWEKNYRATLAERYGLILRDRSSMAAKGISVGGGVIDAGYRGEIVVMLTLHNKGCIREIEPGGNYRRFAYGYQIKAGDKIAQALPIRVMTDQVVEVSDIDVTARGADGFGSTGR